MDDVTLIRYLRDIVEHNNREMERVGGDQTYAEGLYTLESNGQDVYDFFLDETMRDYVEPLEYYKKEKIEEVVNRWVKK